MQRMPPGRTAIEKVELRFPGVAALIARLLAKAPEPIRRRALAAAFSRAEAAFNRGDLEALFAMFADEVEYQPPPALSGETIHGKRTLLHFWSEVLRQYPDSAITNLRLEEAAPSCFTRTIRLTHHSDRGQTLSYELRQTTELSRGRVVRQVNHAVD